MSKKILEKIAWRDSGVEKSGREPSAELQRSIKANLQKRRQRRQKETKKSGNKKGRRKEEYSVVEVDHYPSLAESGIFSPIINANLRTIDLKAGHPLFLMLVEEIARWTNDRQWQFVLSQLADEV